MATRRPDGVDRARPPVATRSSMICASELAGNRDDGR